MNEGLIIDALDFGVNNKVIFVFSKDSYMEKFYIYPSKSRLFTSHSTESIDYLVLIKYELQKKSKKLEYDIIDKFTELRKNYNKLVTGAILCDYLKNSLIEGSSSLVKYDNIIFFINLLSKTTTEDKRYYLTIITIFIYFLIINSGALNVDIKNYSCDNIDKAFLYYNPSTNEFFISEDNHLFKDWKIEYIEEFISLLSINLNDYNLLEKFIFNFQRLEIKKIDNFLFFFSNLFNLVYHRKYVKSFYFVKLIK